MGRPCVALGAEKAGRQVSLGPRVSGLPSPGPSGPAWGEVTGPGSPEAGSHTDTPGKFKSGQHPGLWSQAPLSRRCPTGTLRGGAPEASAWRP